MELKKAMIEAINLKPGNRVLVDGQPKVVLDARPVKLGKGAAFVFAKVRDLDTGATRELKLGLLERLPEWTPEDAPRS